jgi:hypothetical protein
MKVSGRCYCGQISFEAEIEPDKVRVCHCTRWALLRSRRWTGLSNGTGER